MVPGFPPRTIIRLHVSRIAWLCTAAPDIRQSLAAVEVGLTCIDKLGDAPPFFINH